MLILRHFLKGIRILDTTVIYHLSIYKEKKSPFSGIGSDAQIDDDDDDDDDASPETFLRYI